MDEWRRFYDWAVLSRQKVENIDMISCLGQKFSGILSAYRLAKRPQRRERLSQELLSAFEAMKTFYESLPPGNRHCPHFAGARYRLTPEVWSGTGFDISVAADYYSAEVRRRFPTTIFHHCHDVTTMSTILIERVSPQGGVPGGRVTSARHWHRPAVFRGLPGGLWRPGDTSTAHHANASPGHRSRRR